MKTFILAIGLLLVPSLNPVIYAEDTKTIQSKGVIGCLTEDALDEFATAAINKDRRQGMELLQSGQCFSISGRPYSIVDFGFFVTEIRVYTENGSVRLFTKTEFVHQ